ncbi:MAG TPA: M15 family metallopeptidase [Candidatus Saccharimonadales bacterium]|nr:M15 family metallopeptidase [Candidatus Saccharimonadales bacterium]
MATKTPVDPRDSLHGEDEVKPRFGPGSDDAVASGDSSDPRGLDNAGAGKSSDPRGEKSIAAGDLDEAEGRGGVGSRGGVDSAEAGATDQLGKGFTGGAAIAGGQLGRAMALLARNKRKTAGGALGGFIIASLLLLFMTAQGPLELVHLGEILQKNFRGQQSASSSRFNKLFRNGVYRFAKTGEVGETRVGRWGSKYVHQALDELKGQGIEFKERTALGRFKAIEIDTANPDSPYSGMSDGEIRADLNLPDNPELLQREGSKVIVNVEPTSVKNLKLQRMLSKTLFRSLEKGTITTAMLVRWFGKFFGIPDMFHPIHRKAVASLEKLIQKFGNEEGSVQAEEERSQPREGFIKNKFGSAQDSLRDKLGGKEDLLSKGLIATGVMCLVRGTADEVVKVNEGVVTASELNAVDKIAVGSQVEYGQDISLEQAGAIKNSFKDKKGHTIWEGKALDATAHDGKGTGKDIPSGYSQAFSPATTVKNIKDAISLKVHTPAGNIDFGGLACSTPGLIAQAVFNLALLVAAAPTDGATLAVYTGEQGLSAGAYAGAAYFLQKVFVKLLASDAVVPAVSRGPLGGNILAYGARAAANMSARARGGVELAGSFATVMDKDLEQQDQAEFQSKSLFARMFDVNDYRSLASVSIDGMSGSPAQEISSIASSLTNFGGMFSKLFSSLIPQAHAAQPDYKWAFPRYGIPNSILNDPAFQDPYDNADKVAKILDKNDDYIDRAERCFGVDIAKDSGVWDVKITDKDVNPNSDEYIDSNCDHTGDKNWRRVILFVFDTRLTDAVACYEGDDDACDRQAINPGESTGSGSSTTSETAGETFDSSKLYESSVSIACAPGTKDLGVQDGYHEGKKIKIRVCGILGVPETGGTSSVPGANGKLVMNSLVSGAVVKMFKDAKDAGISPIEVSEGFRTMAEQTHLYECKPGCGVGNNPVATPGTSNHQMGLAMDVDGAMQAWMIDHGQKYGFKWFGPGDSVHFSPDGS